MKLNTEPDIRIGVIGAGANTREKHIPKLAAIDGVDIVGVANRSHASSEKVVRQFGLSKVYIDWHEIIEDKEINAVVIGTWPNLHAPVAIAALTAGKHVLTEARMASSASEARAMFETSQDNPDLVAQVVPSPFTLHADRTIQRLVSEGFLGELLVIDVQAGGAFLDRDGPLTWRQDYELSGCNVMQLGIWYEAIMRWVGPATRVMAMGKTFVKMRRDGTGVMRAVRIPEHMDVVADMTCGAQAHFRMSAVTPFVGPPSATLYGSDAALRFIDGKLFSVKKGGKDWKEVRIPADENIGWRVEEEFVRSIRGSEIVTRTTFYDGLQYMEFTDAVARSLAVGRAVPLPLMPG